MKNNIRTKQETTYNRNRGNWRKGMVACFSMLVVAAMVPSSVLAVPIEGGDIIYLDAPQTKVNKHLKPYDEPLLVANGNINPWFCARSGLNVIREVVEGTMASWNSETHKKKPNKSVLSPILDDFITESETFLKIKTNDSVAFWTAQMSSPFDEFSRVRLDPSQGEKVEKQIKHCYTKDELAAYQREAVRWANYMNKIWIPKQEKKYRL